VAYANNGSCDDVDVGNWDNQEDYDEERADNRIDARSKIDAKSGKQEPEAKKMNSKKFVRAVFILGSRNMYWPTLMMLYMF
jgi:hypothetical protein